MYMSIFRSKGFLKFAADNILHIIAQFLEYFSHCCGRFCKERMHPPGFQFSCTKEERLQILSESVFFFYFQDLRDDTFVSNDTKNMPTQQNQIAKECGNSEVLKLKLHLNSEIYRQEVFKILVRRKVEFFLASLEKAQFCTPQCSIFSSSLQHKLAKLLKISYLLQWVLNHQDDGVHKCQKIVVL